MTTRLLKAAVRAVRRTAAGALAIALAGVAPWALADDIDIYSLAATGSGRPTVLFVIDNSANWSSSIGGTCDNLLANVIGTKADGTKMGIEKCALYDVIASMDVATLSLFNIGIMMFNEPPATNDSGFPRYAFTNITTPAQKTALLAVIASLDVDGDKASKAPMAQTLSEAYLWLTGGLVWHGNLMAGTSSSTKLDTTAFTDSSLARYVSPAIAGCFGAHIVYLANGSPQESYPNASARYQAITNTSGNPAELTPPTSLNVDNSDSNNLADEFAYFFRHQTDISSSDGTQPITTHAIAVVGAPSDGNYPNYMQWVAQQGGGFFATTNNTSGLVDAIKKILNEVRASNSVFASASLPVSANAQGTYLNQVFIGMFRPDANAYERWVGNLKQYQFSYATQGGTLQLADANGNAAVSTSSGFISPNAQSFWTHSGTFWQNISPATPSDAPDGATVERGGAAQLVRDANLNGSGNRTVYTCPTGCSAGTALSGNVKNLFSSNNSTLTNAYTSFGYSSKTQAGLLIDWMRGDNNVTPTNVTNATDYAAAVDQLGQPNPVTATVRPQVHGDVLHTRPVVVNYAVSSSTNTSLVVFYGSNDGMLHAINGNQTGAGAGSELWAFVAPEHYSRLNRLRENEPEILFPTTPAGTTAAPRDYFFDGPIGLYQNVTSGIVDIFVSMRRGGRTVYAFDVTTPTSPTVLWKFSNTDSGYSKLGQTWSQAKIARIKGSTDPVLVMGGGYDNVAEDASPQGVTTMGNLVYVLNVSSGAVLQSLNTLYSVPADVALVDTDGDGYIDRAYVLDVRAQLYRIDFEDAGGNPLGAGHWVITQIGAFNDGSGGLSGSRKTFFAPDIVISKNFAVIQFGTGDREKPLLATSNDQFFVVEDTNTSKGPPTVTSLITPATLGVITTSTSTTTTTQNGCALPLSNGEKVINQAVTFGGITYFSTNKPSGTSTSTSCYRGQSTAYELPLLCQPPNTQVYYGDGLPPSPVVGYVSIGGSLQPFVIGGINNNNSPIQAKKPTINIPSTRKRTYWYIEDRDR